jgi:hypothetical protein
MGERTTPGPLCGQHSIGIKPRLCTRPQSNAQSRAGFFPLLESWNETMDHNFAAFEAGTMKPTT